MIKILSVYNRRSKARERNVQIILIFFNFPQYKWKLNFKLLKVVKSDPNNAIYGRENSLIGYPSSSWLNKKIYTVFCEIQ